MGTILLLISEKKEKLQVSINKRKLQHFLKFYHNIGNIIKI